MAGRVLSKNNETRLRAALAALTEVLGLLDDPAEDDPVEDEPVCEAALGLEFVPLVERAVRRDGTIPVKLIQPGWGSSGYYPPEVLERDGPAMFPAGTKMFWNHPTVQEEAERPEGDLRNLAAELVTPARYEQAGVQGPGLYADAKVFSPFQEVVNELAPHIGVSIRAAGRAAQGEAEGRRGPIIQQIVTGRSVDFVTEPGAGGRIIEMFEAARTTATRLPAAVTTTDKNELSDEEVGMSTEVEAQLAEAMRQIEELRQQNARLNEALLLREAQDFVTEQVRQTQMPDATRRRVVTALAANPPVVDGRLDRDRFAQQIAEAVRQEMAYLSEAAGLGDGRIVGMGASTAGATSDEVGRLRESFARLGLGGDGLAAAVKGRGGN